MVFSFGGGCRRCGCRRWERCTRRSRRSKRVMVCCCKPVCRKERYTRVSCISKVSRCTHDRIRSCDYDIDYDYSCDYDHVDDKDDSDC